MSKVTGVNKSKAMKFGKPFLELIKKYAEENGIQRPEDVVIKSVANKSARKIAIITSIDKKQKLEDIERSLGLNREDLLREVENIILSGTKLGLKPYINEVMDESQQAEIMDYFRESEEDSLDDAINEFGSEFSKDEIQLMRLNFISEVAF
jgi:ATP-dependent DNA helicase RecQ